MQRLWNRGNAEEDAALQKIADLPAPPGIMEKSAVTIKPPTQDDYLNTFRFLYSQSGLKKTDEELAEIYNYIFGDTKLALSNIHSDILAELTNDIAAFIGKQHTDFNDNQRVISYCAAIKDRLVKFHQSQISALGQSINSEIKAIMSDGITTSLNEVMPQYIAARYEILFIYQQIASGLYNAALDYYRSRWEASHTNLATLKKERETFNAIFKGIAEINEDFTITPYDKNLNLFVRYKPEEIQNLLTEQIKLARFNKLDTTKSSFNQLIENLALLNNIQQNPQGDLFSPVTANDKKIMIVFHDRVHKTFQHYQSLKNRLIQKRSDQTPADELAVVARSHKDAKNRITESTFSIEEISKTALQTAQNNIELFKSCVQDERDILESILDLEYQIKPADEDIHALRTPTSKITSIGLSPQTASALIDAFNNGLLRHKLAATDAAQKIHEKLYRLKTDTSKILSDADNTAETLQPIAINQYLQDIKLELGEIKQQISKLQQIIDEAKREQNEAADLLEKIQNAENAAIAAEQYYQDFTNGLQREDYFSGEDEHHPFSEAERAFNALKSHRMVKDLPHDVRTHLLQRERSFAQIRMNFSAVIRCHLLLNSLLNLKYWKSVSDDNVPVIAGGKTYHIPKSIFALIEITQQPGHQNWATDAEEANRLLADIQFVAKAEQGKSVLVRSFLAAASQADNTPLVFDGANTVTRKMFFNPLRMIDPQEIHTIQKKPTWSEKHPIAKKVLQGLLGGFIALCVIGLGIAIAMAIPPAAGFLIGLATTISHAVGGTAVFGTLCGIAGAAVLGIGTGIGYIAGKIAYARQQRQKKSSPNPFVDAPAPVAFVPPAQRPKAPSHPPRQLTQAEIKAARSRQSAATVSSSQFAMHQPAASIKPAIVDKQYFELEIVREIIDKYSGKPGIHDESPTMRAQFIKLWEKSKNNIETFLFEIEATHKMTAKNIISEVVTSMNKKYPGLVETYPPNSLIRRRLIAPEPAVQPAAANTGSRRR